MSVLRHPSFVSLQLCPVCYFKSVPIMKSNFLPWHSDGRDFFCLSCPVVRITNCHWTHHYIWLTYRFLKIKCGHDELRSTVGENDQIKQKMHLFLKIQATLLISCFISASLGSVGFNSGLFTPSVRFRSVSLDGFSAGIDGCEGKTALVDAESFSFPKEKCVGWIYS